VFAALLIASGAFSGTETALFSLDRIQRRRLAESSSLRSQLIARVLRHPRRLLSTILFGNTLVNVAASAVSTLFFGRMFGHEALGVAIVVATVLVIIVGEVVPKTIAVNAPGQVSQISIMPLHFFARLSEPVVTVFDRAARKILRLLDVPEEAGGGLSASELELLFEEAGRSAMITPQETEMARNIIRFSETTAEEIMTPRVDVVAAPLDISRDALRARMTDARHSRIPIYEGDVDNIVGFVSTKEFFLNPGREIRELLKPVAIFPENAKIHRVLRHMQRNRINMAVIVNEYGETTGIATMEDVVEEIVGELYDEYEKAEVRIRQVGPTEWMVLCRASVEDVNDTIGLTLPDEDSVTLNGYLTDEFGEIPTPGRVLERDGARFTVVESTRRRIVSCRVETTGREEVIAGDG
jgi:CBS domain containing-hemolysin-like protein